MSYIKDLEDWVIRQQGRLQPIEGEVAEADLNFDSDTEMWDVYLGVHKEYAEQSIEIRVYVADNIADIVEPDDDEYVAPTIERAAQLGLQLMAERGYG